ncbi:2-amino-4-hydroxy-6-hydroxymethyldihydropteridine diphosphokinase [Limnobacter humi]|uniref:2-amino-4-hydroxy-6-hydroxymethyldihydropteridine pyrophosphokinase n=1 Tax=Limnobacter humi TaxID=1778671 RepID=A0ABT1WH02_9BURK|nr:2-amino-4-hydroxy-6-hydroxymethyldihydropteridine diphosphokinase [Limnobacter humi]MCQ8896801.1 2-amino-4-hydroxy-6-hydroxymethyldihydropteridine diphosphokinase [Limnobacter humi]
MTTASTRCYLGLGGNLGNPVSLFDEVIAHVAQHAHCRHHRESPRYESAPVDSSGPNYINSVLELDWAGSADELLATCMSTETALGRVRTVRNAPRLIDVDVLLFGQARIQTPSLTVPHPRMHLRRFVLAPLLDLNPFIEIPGLGAAKLFLPNTQDQVCTRI